MDNPRDDDVCGILQDDTAGEEEIMVEHDRNEVNSQTDQPPVPPQDEVQPSFVNRPIARHIDIDVDAIDRDGHMTEVTVHKRHRRRMSADEVAHIKSEHRRKRIMRRMLYGTVIALWVAAAVCVVWWFTAL